MTFWSVMSLLLALVWLVDGLRLRRRAARLAVLAASSQKIDPAHHFVVRAGAEVDDATRRAASAYATAQNLQVVVLIPTKIPAAMAMLNLQAIDPSSFRRSRIANGRCLGAACLIHTDVIKRLERTPVAPTDALGFATLCGDLKKYANTSTDLVLAPTCSMSATSDEVDGKVLYGVLGTFAPQILAFQLLLLVACLLFAPAAGSAALVFYHLQGILTLAGSRLHPSGLGRFSLLRLPIDFKTVFTSLRQIDIANAAAVAAGRPFYAAMLRAGTAAFFDPARNSCPLCGGTQLRRAITGGDRIQHKPGIFTLDRCQKCQHVFQNPRLSAAGLEFYYRDFYDGLGLAQAEEMFSYGPEPYLARARMLPAAAAPRRWLDVGAGHGHFCTVAREVWPQTAFDALDFGSSVEIAQRRGWADRSYRGIFPALAPTLAGSGLYQVISMSHYLEHTRDPEAEIRAAATVLPAGGHLLIELPDPECLLGQVFGSYWLPWFQPQHQHFLSVGNLERLLRMHSFEPLTWHRGEAHQPTDLFFSLVLLLNRIAPPTGNPWQAPAKAWRALLHQLLFLVNLPLLLLARMLDLALAPMLSRPGWSNTYRVLARRLP